VEITSIDIFPCGLPFRGQFKIAGGPVGNPGDQVQLSGQPGLGLRIDPAKLERYRRT
jgi:hypothetical protein